MGQPDIGIAMGLGGTDVAVETADVALASDDLRRLLDVRSLGGRAVDVIQQNYAMSIAGQRLWAVARRRGRAVAGLGGDSAQCVVGCRSCEQFQTDSLPARGSDLSRPRRTV
jgi:hypothetical protein